MKQCIYCGAELEDNARACNNCGRPVPDMPEKAGAEKKEEAPEQPEQQSTQNPWGQQQEQSAQDPWGQQEQSAQNPWGQQQEQNPQDPWNGWRQAGQPDGQNQWGQPNAQNQWGAQDPQNGQNQWGQPNAQNQWGAPNPQNQQNPWGQQNGQNQWGWQQGTDPRQQGYGYGPNQGNRNGQQAFPQYNKFAIWGLIFGAVASFLNGFLFVPSILAIIFCIIALVQIRNNPGRYRGKAMAIVGLAFGIIFLIVYAYIFSRVFTALQDPETMQQLQKYLQEIGAIE